ncbi:hypothetical protein KVT40_001326 [Elsinoe batatas]|uniref:Uncharacterized protein n=1 Tax=Elsinoe batatas TaxID=2601811 RepID=A0A8K0L5S4_9PEZI|nr:hypothetical protein KVT40_001326 [Elsinoe batatas]
MINCRAMVLPTSPTLYFLQSHELLCFQYFIHVIGPMLDLFDNARHFTDIVPSRRRTSLSSPDHAVTWIDDQRHRKAYCHTKSGIATYEMLDGSNRDWERHLKGAFWIQPCQDNNGESGGLRMAVWWVWLRQDIWAAFRDKRKALTIWRPTKPLVSLTADELATRILYILAKVVQYASEEETSSTGIAARIHQGDQLLRSLQDWHQLLPASFKPFHTEPTETAFPVIWMAADMKTAKRFDCSSRLYHEEMMSSTPGANPASMIPTKTRESEAQSWPIKAHDDQGSRHGADFSGESQPRF